MSRVGPKLTIDASCLGCCHEQSKSYRAQGDSGHDVYCVHPSAVPDERGRPMRYVGDTRWNTPDWCPELATAKAALLRAEGGAQ